MTTVSPEEARRLFPDQRPVITRVDDGAEYVRQPDGRYVLWFSPPWWPHGNGHLFMEPFCLQNHLDEKLFPHPQFK